MQPSVKVAGYGLWGQKVVQKLRHNSDVKQILVLGSKNNQDDLFIRDHKEFCRIDNVDEFYLCAPPNINYELCEILLENNAKNIFIEKPFLATSQQLDKLEKNIKDKNIQFDYLFVFDKLMPTLRQAIKEKHLIKFSWQKLSKNSDIFNNLFVHDLAMILSILEEIEEIKIKKFFKTETKLAMELSIDKSKFKFHYDISQNGKNIKKLTINETDFSFLRHRGPKDNLSKSIQT